MGYKYWPDSYYIKEKQTDKQTNKNKIITKPHGMEDTVSWLLTLIFNLGFLCLF